MKGDVVKYASETDISIVFGALRCEEIIQFIDFQEKLLNDKDFDTTRTVNRHR